MEKVVEAIPLEPYRIKVRMKSGLEGIFDMSPYLDGQAFHELKDPAYFKRVRPEGYGIIWPHEQDISSDTILCDIQDVKPEGGLSEMSQDA